MGLIGIDIGGTHISAARVFPEGEKVEFGTIHEANVDTYQSAEKIISDWSAVISKAIGNQKEVFLGIAMPGPFDYPNGVSLIKDQGKMNSLYSLPVKDLLVESLNIEPQNIAFTNDAEAFLLGESIAGVGRSFENSIGLTLGTGLGSAIKIHNVVKDGKLWTAPFRNGIAEDFLGTSWFKKITFEKFGVEISGVKDLLLEDFDQTSADRIFEEFGLNLGEFLSEYVIRFQCQGVILGGKIARASDRFLPFTFRYLEKYQFPIEIKPSLLQEKATLIGSCHSFLSQHI
jgi:glucokinase